MRFPSWLSASVAMPGLVARVRVRTSSPPDSSWRKLLLGEDLLSAKSRQLRSLVVRTSSPLGSWAVLLVPSERSTAKLTRHLFASLPAAASCHRHCRDTVQTREYGTKLSPLTAARSRRFPPVRLPLNPGTQRKVGHRLSWCFARLQWLHVPSQISLRLRQNRRDALAPGLERTP